MIEQAIVDHKRYEGMDIEVGEVNFAPNGWKDLNRKIRVTVKDLSFDEWHEDYLDVYWNVEVKQSDLAEFCSRDSEINDEAPDAYIRAYSYEFDASGKIESSEPLFICPQESLEQKIIQAAVLGTIAYKNGLGAVPSLDSALMQLLEGLKVGEGCIFIMKAWAEAWAAASLSSPVNLID